MVLGTSRLRPVAYMAELTRYMRHIDMIELPHTLLRAGVYTQ